MWFRIKTESISWFILAWPMGKALVSADPGVGILGMEEIRIDRTSGNRAFSFDFNLQKPLQNKAVVFHNPK